MMVEAVFEILPKISPKESQHRMFIIMPDKVRRKSESVAVYLLVH